MLFAVAWGPCPGATPALWRKECRPTIDLDRITLAPSDHPFEGMELIDVAHWDVAHWCGAMHAVSDSSALVLQQLDHRDFPEYVKPQLQAGQSKVYNEATGLALVLSRLDESSMDFHTSPEQLPLARANWRAMRHDVSLRIRCLLGLPGLCSGPCE